MCHHVCYYVPEHMLANIAKARAMDRTRESVDPGNVQRSAAVSSLLRRRRQEAAWATLNPPAAPPAPGKGAAHKGLTIPQPGTHARLIYDDQNQSNFDVQFIRGEGDPAVAQQNANLAYDALGATLEFYQNVLGRNSIDNLGLNLDANVNYGVS